MRKKMPSLKPKQCIFLSIIFIITALYISYAKISFKTMDSRSNTTIASEISSEKNDADNLNKEVNAEGLMSTEGKNPSWESIKNIKLIPGGQSIGVKLNIDGIFVVGFSEIDTKSGRKQSPAMLGGIQIGDSLTEVDGQKLESSMQLSKIIGNSSGRTIVFKVKRKNAIKTFQVKPMPGGFDYSYKAGIWVRDSTAGVGTLTFINPKTKEFGALGHPINDVDTGLLLPVKDGRIYDSKIISVEYSTKGKPGELRGIFSKEDEIGSLNKNTNEGIYGKLDNQYIKTNKNMLLSIAEQNEIKEGPAKILTSIDGINVKEYNINIERCTKQSEANPKSMVIKITDEQLLKKTGGIVQGMSGSPIIQNNKLVGAVTHVFVNRPSMGYGIYIEWMLTNLKPSM